MNDHSGPTDPSRPGEGLPGGEPALANGPPNATSLDPATREALLGRLQELQRYQDRLTNTTDPQIRALGTFGVFALLILGLYAAEDPRVLPYFYGAGLAVLGCAYILWKNRLMRQRLRLSREDHIDRIKRDFPAALPLLGGAAALHDPLAVDALVDLLETKAKPKPP